MGHTLHVPVSLCVREWIETEMARAVVYGITVSLCVREWIDPPLRPARVISIQVSLCVREWIETGYFIHLFLVVIGLPLREGVD